MFQTTENWIKPIKRGTMIIQLFTPGFTQYISKLYFLTIYMFIIYAFLGLQTHPLKGSWVSIASVLPHLRVFQGNTPERADRTWELGSTKPHIDKPRPFRICLSSPHLWTGVNYKFLNSEHHTFWLSFKLHPYQSLLSDVGRWNSAPLLVLPAWVVANLRAAC